MQDHDSDVPDEVQRPQFEAIRPGQGDFRGSYGYGRPAYRPDPEARYSFAPVSRVLPPAWQRRTKP
jgi:hypothetical protein